MLGQVEEPEVKTVVADRPQHEEAIEFFFIIFHFDHSRSTLPEYKLLDSAVHVPEFQLLIELRILAE